MVKPSPGSAKIDWRKLSAIEINSFESELSSNRWSLEEIASMIAYSFIDSEFDTHSLDSNFVKLFKLSQILIGYLLDKYYYQYKELKEQFDSISEITAENRKLRKLLDIYKQTFTFGGGSLITKPSGHSLLSDGNNYDNHQHHHLHSQHHHYQCPNCPKAFGDANYLQSHIIRRHPEGSLDSKSWLPLARTISQYSSTLLTSSTESVDNIKQELAILKEQLKKTEEQLAGEREARLILQQRLESELEIKMKQFELQWRGINDSDDQQQIKQSQTINKIPSLSSPVKSTSLSSSDDDPTNQQDQPTNDESPTVEPIDSEAYHETPSTQITRPNYLPIVPNSHEIESKAKDLTGLLLVHTQEVRNLGNRLEKLVDQLTSNGPMVSPCHRSQPTIESIAKSPSDGSRSSDLNSTSTPVLSTPLEPEVIINSSKQEKKSRSTGRDQVLSYVDRYLTALGISNAPRINAKEFTEAMNVIHERRRRFQFQGKVDALKEAIDYEVRTRKIGETLKVLNQESQGSSVSIGTSNQVNLSRSPGSQSLDNISSTTASPWSMARSSLESLQSNSESPKKRKFDSNDQESLTDHLKSTETKKMDEAKKRLKSVLIIRDAQGNRIGRDSSQPKRRIHFSDKRIEISPEYSSDDDDFDEMMSSKTPSATVSIQETDLSNHSLQITELDSSLLTGPSHFQQQQSTSDKQEIPPTPKPRTSTKPFNLDDHLKAADLKWFDSDGSDIEDDLDNRINQDSNESSSPSSSLRVIDTSSVDQDQLSKISVQELTKIIEEQLHTRANSNRKKLTNSVDVVTGEYKPTSTGTIDYDVKPVGTLHYNYD